MKKRFTTKGTKNTKKSRHKVEKERHKERPSQSPGSREEPTFVPFFFSFVSSVFLFVSFVLFVVKIHFTGYFSFTSSSASVMAWMALSRSAWVWRALMYQWW